MIPLRENPVFRRDMGWTGGFLSRMVKVPVICWIIGVLWVAVVAVAVAVGLRDLGEEESHRPFAVLWSVYTFGLQPPILFPLGFWVSYGRFAADCRNQLFQHLYFCGLDSREIVRGKLLALLLPMGMVLGVMFVSLGVATAVLGLHWTAARSTTFSAFGYSAGGTVTGFGFWGVLWLALGEVALLSGFLGGMRVAILGRRGRFLSEMGLQFVLWVTTFCCSLISLVNLNGYNRVVWEFWWHAVYLESEANAGAERL